MLVVLLIYKGHQTGALLWTAIVALRLIIIQAFTRQSDSHQCSQPGAFCDQHAFWQWRRWIMSWIFLTGPIRYSRVRFIMPDDSQEEKRPLFHDFTLAFAAVLAALGNKGGAFLGDLMRLRFIAPFGEAFIVSSIRPPPATPRGMFARKTRWSKFIDFKRIIANQPKNKSDKLKHDLKSGSHLLMEGIAE
jgi:hypothetical protein